MPTVQELKELGESMQLSGAELTDFIKEQQTLEREERARERDEKEKERKFQAEREEKERQFQAEREDAVRAKMASELKAQEQQNQFEMARLEMQLRLQEQEAKLKQTQKVAKEEDGTNTAETTGKGLGKVPRMPYFDEERDFMDSYLGRFERFAEAQKWKKGDWATYLSALLRGRALDVYSRLPVDQANDFKILKEALLKRYQLSAEGFKTRFRSAKPELGETPAQFLTRIDNYLQRWMELANIEKTYEGLKTLIVQEQYLSVCPKELALFLKERTPESIKDLGTLAEKYVEAHATQVVPGTDPKQNRIRSLLPEPRRCHNCGSTSHLKNACPKKSTMPPPQTWKSWQTPQQKQPRPSSPHKPPPTCFNCGKKGHIAKPAAAAEFYTPEEVQEQAAACQPLMQIPTAPPMTGTYERTCRKHQSASCPECFNSPAPIHHCQALVAMCEECGQQRPVIADACQSQERCQKMPVSDGTVDNQPVTVLRDTGCSTVVVRRSLVPDHKLTGREERCILIDGTVRRTPVAEIFVNTPFYKGFTTAVCMKNPLYDLIIGNINGVTNLNTAPQPVLAVQTRSQAKVSGIPTPLVTPEIDLGPVDVATLQVEDDSLRHAMDAAKEKTNPQFQLQHKLLYRVKMDNKGQVVKQLALPEKLRQRVMRLAHAGIMSGHQGAHRTQERIIASFWWPGMSGDISRFCQSCDICQRTISKGRVSKVPLGKVPIIDTPFKRIAVDLVGEISPATSRGHRYILTVVDYATRYPEAIALKRIDTSTIAEALVSIFSRVGIPTEILSDQGTQFTSNLMKEVSRLLSIKQLTTTPYHPQCNGLVERFNGTLKTMLKRMCAEKPKDWDRYIDALLFAYREAPQESIGFAPFEMLYGRSVNGPLRILRQLWTKEQTSPDIRTTYEYVVNLRNRLQETWDLAHEQLSRSQARQKRLYDYKTKERTFQRGDQVLLLLPTSENKLIMHWKGPFEILERVEGHDYRVQLPNRQQIFHANLLKRYLPAVSEEPENTASSAIQTTAAAILEPEQEMIDQGAELSTLNPLQKETYRDVQISSTLTDQQRTDVQTLLQTYQDIFTDVPKITHLGTHEINLTTDEPIKGKAYPLPHAMRKSLDQEIDSMLRMGIIEESAAAYASPVVMVRKPDGSTRVCVDYRKLNSITIFDPEPMPTAEEIFAKLAGDRFFSKFDLSKGYWQVPVREEDRDFTTFICHRGLFRFKVMPFGLINAPATFSRLMRRLLRDSFSLDNYLDDVLTHTPDWSRHLAVLMDFFERIRQANLTLRPTKCEIGETTVSFLGHSLSEGTLLPRQETIDKITNAPRPRTKKQLRAFIGLAGFYRKYVPNFSVIAAPLTDATRKGSSNEVSWDDAREQAFQTLKANISQPPILRLPDVSQPFILQTDASNTGLGAVLLQEDSIGEKHPVAFASRKLQPRETRYSTIERECLAIIWGITKFQEYLYGAEFILETDHQPLQYLRKTQFQNGRLMRWALALQPYRFLLRAIPGKDNVGADCLSRNPLNDDDAQPTE